MDSRGRCLAENPQVVSEVGTVGRAGGEISYSQWVLSIIPLAWGFPGTLKREACSEEYFQDEEGTHEQG